MSFNIDEMTALEQMAKLSLSADERVQLFEIISFLDAGAATLEKVDMEGVLPMVYGADMSNVFRDDVSSQMLPREELLRLAPEHRDGYWQVPRTLE